VSDLRPRLRGGVRVQRQRYRGETWYLLADEASGKQHRINAAAYEFIGRFDGRASVNELWSLLLERFRRKRARPGRNRAHAAAAGGGGAGAAPRR
jgi:putative peptide zinc metalloprotease protein